MHYYLWMRACGLERESLVMAWSKHMELHALPRSRTSPPSSVRSRSRKHPKFLPTAFFSYSHIVRYQRVYIVYTQNPNHHRTSSVDNASALHTHNTHHHRTSLLSPHNAHRHINPPNIVHEQPPPRTKISTTPSPPQWHIPRPEQSQQRPPNYD
jgi:hypothetical protein